MAKKKLATPPIDDSALPYKVVIDFLEGTLRKQDAVAFARGFIENHFDALTDSGYYVAPYEGGYIFEAHEGGPHKAFLPGILAVLADNPQASACVQMARRVLEVKKSLSGVYTAILLPEGTEPQNPDKVFPEPGPKLIPFQRSGMTMLLVGASIFGVGLGALLLSTIIYLVEVSGLLSPPLAKIDYATLPLTQWERLKQVGGSNSEKYVKAIRLQDGHWVAVPAERQEIAPDVVPPGGYTPPLPAPVVPQTSNPLAPPMLPGQLPDAGGVPPAARTAGATGALPPPPSAFPPSGTTH